MQENLPRPLQLLFFSFIKRSFSAFLIASSVFSFWFASGEFFFAVCLSLIRFTVSCFLNFFNALVGHLSCFVRLDLFIVWLDIYHFLRPIGYCVAKTHYYFVDIPTGASFRESRRIGKNGCRFQS